MKISFDFDSTLTRPDIQEIADSLSNQGHEIFITTSRFAEWKWKGVNKNHNKDLYSIAKELGIPKGNIRFTNGENKVKYLNKFDMHFDDDEFEIDLITRSEIKCLGILINYKNYNV